MRWTSCLALLLLVAPARAQDEGDATAEAGRKALALVRKLDDTVSGDAPWNDRFNVYLEAKKAVDQAEAAFQKDLTTKQKAALAEELDRIKRERGPEHGDYGSPAGKAYEAIRKEVAESLRRQDLPLSGWIMGLVGIILLWGGFSFCVGRAMRTGKDRPPEA